jgi:hypothetical protein
MPMIFMGVGWWKNISKSNGVKRSLLSIHELTKTSTITFSNVYSWKSVVIFYFVCCLASYVHCWILLFDDTYCVAGSSLGECLVVMLVLHFGFMVLQLEGDTGWKTQTNQTFQSNGRVKYLDSKFVCSCFFDFGLLHWSMRMLFWMLRTLFNWWGRMPLVRELWWPNQANESLLCFYFNVGIKISEIVHSGQIHGNDEKP